MNENMIRYESEAPGAAVTLETTKLHLESGILGRVFGSSKNAPMNIAGLLIALLLLPGIALLFFTGSMTAGDYWKMMLPVLSLVIGYTFGKNQ